MDYTEFKVTVRDEMDRRTGHTLTLSINHLLKNNGTITDTLCITDPQCNISPNIHLEPYYNRYLGGMDLDDILDSIETAYFDSCPEEDFDLSFYTDFNRAKHRIIYRLINFEQNKELLSDVPHERVLDLALVYYVLLDQKDDTIASILIHNSHLAMWKTDTATVGGYARKNTPRLVPVHIEPLNDIVRRMHCFPEEDLEQMPSFLYILTGNTMTFSAGAMLYPDILKKIASELNSDLYILPSSIHEVLVLSAECSCSREYLDDMVRYVNDYEVADSEILSDHCYYYDRTTHELSM